MNESFAGCYTLVQFRPHVVTEEFVNIGVILACDKLKYFDYQLIGAEGIDRISNFFHDYDMGIYTEGLIDFIDNLNYLKNDSMFKSCTELLKYVARPLESTFKCNTNIGAICIVDDNPDQTLNMLFQSCIAKYFIKGKH